MALYVAPQTNTGIENRIIIETADGDRDHSQGENMHNHPEDLIGKKVIVFDAEIKNVIDLKTITWNDHHLMGISVAVGFHYETMEYRVYMDDNIGELYAAINDADLVSGFNILGFDIPLFQKTPPIQLVKPKKVYDMLEYSRRAVGWFPGARFPSGLKLDNHLEGTFGESFMKTEDGANAPVFWQQGKIGKVISYCVADVKRELTLFEHIWKGLPVVTAAHGKRILEKPTL